MVQEIIVYAVGVVVAVFIAMRIYRIVRRKDNACGCGCGDGCGPDIMKEARKAAKERSKGDRECGCGS